MRDKLDDDVTFIKTGPFISSDKNGVNTPVKMETRESEKPGRPYLTRETFRFTCEGKVPIFRDYDRSATRHVEAV